MARPRANLRLFVAVYPPRDLARQCNRFLEQLDLPPFRPVPIDQLHLTLQFIGDTPVKDMERTIESIERATAGLQPFDLTIDRLIALPEGRDEKPRRLIAVQTSAPATLLELQRRLATRLAGKPRTNNSRPFRPHLTLCRFLTPSVVSLASGTLEPESFTVSSIHLMRSTLSPDGAVHEPVGHFPLG